MTHSLQNKLALITGAASGLGLASAQLFASQGADLALVDISPKMTDIAKNLQTNYPNVRVSAHVFDITVSSNINKLFDEIKEHHQAKHHCPTVLVNSAGISIAKNMLEMTEKDYDTTINGTFLVTQALIKQLIPNYTNVKFDSPTQSYASIVNFSSVLSRFGWADMCHYGITKAGVEGFTKCLAKEYGQFRIRCNAIAPGCIDTPMTGSMTEELREFFKKQPALKRIGKADEVAQLIYFLATDSSSFITGASIDINGGY